MGAATPPNSNSAYRSYNIAAFMGELVRTRSDIVAALATDPTPVHFLDRNTSSGPVVSRQCSNPSSIDYLYDASYLQPLLQRALAGSIWNDSWVILVDCSFDGRIHLDTSVIKVYVADRGLDTFGTMVLQTTAITRPSKHRRMPGGAAFLALVSVASLSWNDVDHRVETHRDATYFVSLGFSFPHEPFIFEPIALSTFEPTSGIWQADVISTNERVFFACTTGLYRKSPDIQGSFNYYYWALPPNAVEFATVLEFFDVHQFKDSWGWGRCFLGLGIGVNLAVNSVVAGLVVVRTWRTDGVLWVPDLYPSIQRRASARVVLLLVDCVCNEWWYPFQWAVNQATYRNALGGTMDFNDAARADTLLFCLASAHATATVLRVRIHLFVVVVVFAVCDSHRLALVNAIGCFRNHANGAARSISSGNIVHVSRVTMDMWAYHENTTTDFKLIANEYTYLWVAMAIGQVYVVAVKLTGDRRENHPRQSPPRAVPPTSVVPVSQSRRPPPRMLTRGNHKHWAHRSTLYFGVVSDDSHDNTLVERSVGRVSRDVVGFVAPTIDYDMQRGRPVATPSSVWLLGFVIVNDSVLVAINDYMFLVLNAILKTPFFVVYGFPLNAINAVAPPTLLPKQQLHPDDVHRI